MIDRGYLTVEGAKIFGERLINLKKFDVLDWIAHIMPNIRYE